MSSKTKAPADYSGGNPRPHHQFYRDAGDTLIQVQNAIFKIHRFFLIDHSSVLRDMLSLPQSIKGSESANGTPIVISGDTAKVWELLLASFYRARPMAAMDYTDEECLELLALVHKYGMEGIEEDLISYLEEDQTTEGWVDLILASRIAGCNHLYERALEGLRQSWPLPNLEQAKKIGIEATHALLGWPGCYECGTDRPNPLRCTQCRHLRQDPAYDKRKK